MANREGLNRHRYWVNRMKNKSGWYRCVSDKWAGLVASKRVEMKENF